LKQALLFLLLLIANAQVLAAPKGLGPLPALYQELDRYVKERVNRNDAIGSSIAVVDHGEVVFMKSYGVRKKGESAKVDFDTVFQLGSISKPITASLVELANKQNLLSLDTPVRLRDGSLLPKTKVRHILSHTSGYARKGWNWKIEAGWPRDKLLKELSGCEQDELGQRFDYHNVAFSLIEDMLADAFKMPFHDALKRFLLTPLGMTRTTIGFEDFKKQKNRAWPHEQRRRKRKLKWQPCRRYSHAYHASVASAGGVNSSIRDMARFLQFQMGAFPKVATLDDLSKLYTPAVQAPDAKAWFKHELQGNLKSFYGYGWRIIEINGERLVYHGGWLHGFMSFMAFSPKDEIGIVVLNNSESSFGLSTAIHFFKEAMGSGRLALRFKGG
jgi:beta-lactamase class C